MGSGLIVAIVVASGLTAGVLGYFWLLGGDCGPYYSAEWHEPGLYDALRPLRERGDIRAEDIEPYPWRQVPAGDGLPFDATVLGFDAGEVKLLDVGTAASPGRFGSDGASLVATDASGGAMIRLETWGNKSADELRALFDLLVSRVGGAGNDTVDRWFDELVATKKDAHDMDDPPLRRIPVGSALYIYEAPAAGPWRLDSLYRELEAAQTPEIHRAVASEIRVFANWTFDFEAIATQIWLDAPQGGAPYMMQIGAADHLILDRERGGLGGNETATREAVASMFSELGLPAPTFQGWSYGGAIC